MLKWLVRGWRGAAIARIGGSRRKVGVHGIISGPFHTFLALLCWVLLHGSVASTL
jgi:hypothetical protein